MFSINKSLFLSILLMSSIQGQAYFEPISAIEAKKAVTGVSCRFTKQGVIVALADSNHIYIKSGKKLVQLNPEDNNNHIMFVDTQVGKPLPMQYASKDTEMDTVITEDTNDSCRFAIGDKSNKSVEVTLTKSCD